MSVPTPRQLAELGFARTFDQIGIVVTNLDQALEAYTDGLGIEPWVGWMYDQHLLARRSFRGEEGRYTMRLAVHGAHPQVELLEPIDGPSIFHEFLDTRGPGLHHVAYFVPSFGEAEARLSGLGFPLVQSGAWEAMAHSDISMRAPRSASISSASNPLKYGDRLTSFTRDRGLRKFSSDQS